MVPPRQIQVIKFKLPQQYTDFTNVSAKYETLGKYVLLDRLATGGMAEVFLARAQGAGGIGKFFAVKRILPQYVENPEFITMFEEEAKIAMNLNHSNIVSVHEFHEAKGQYYLVMDFVEGRNLRQIINKMKKTNVLFSIDQILYVIKEVAAGLDHAHHIVDKAKGKPLNLIHRDISPQNIMVSFEGEVKIVDFGIAKAESQVESTRAGTLKGKFGYMSPEQADSQPIDLRTDIFSLGIVLWELLANDRLFTANNELNILRKIKDCQIPSLRKINPNIHTELERIVQRALARDRNLRYQTAAALHRDLNRFLNRQYPDFTAQDFAVSIKSIFADDILALRKKLTGFANEKLNFSIDVRKQDQVSYNLSEDTSSMVSTNTSSQESSEVVEEAETGPHGTVKVDSDIIEVPASPKQRAQLEATNLTKTERTPTEGNSSAISIKVEADSAPRMGPPKVGVLDESALASAALINQDSQPKNRANDNRESALETEEITAPSYRRSQSIVRRNTSTQIVMPQYESSLRPARFVTFAVFSLLCLGIYSTLVKYFPVMMAPVVKMTDPVLHPWHAILAGQRLPANDQYNYNPGNQGPGQDLNNTKRFELPPAGDIEINKPPMPTTDSMLNIASNPSGAEILLNNKPVDAQTPAQVPVPSEATFSIIIRKKGYYDFVYKNVTLETLGKKIDATLQKQNLAYLNVEIFPPQEATLYVNGKQVPIYRTKASDIPIPAGVNVKVRAESRSSNTFDEVIVNLPTDTKKSIQVRPRRFRKP